MMFNDLEGKMFHGNTVLYIAYKDGIMIDTVFGPKYIVVRGEQNYKHKFFSIVKAIEKNN